jgi:hypothetical protein
MIDLDDTAQCPIDEHCSGCGGGPNLGNRILRVVTAEAQVGVFCMTVCQKCSPEGWQLPLVWTTERVLEHCGHLGIDADQMAAAMEGR